MVVQKWSKSGPGWCPEALQNAFRNEGPLFGAKPTKVVYLPAKTALKGKPKTSPECFFVPS